MAISINEAYPQYAVLLIRPNVLILSLYGWWNEPKNLEQAKPRSCTYRASSGPVFFYRSSSGPSFSKMSEFG